MIDPLKVALAYYTWVHANEAWRRVANDPAVDEATRQAISRENSELFERYCDFKDGVTRMRDGGPAKSRKFYVATLGGHRTEWVTESTVKNALNQSLTIDFLTGAKQFQSYEGAVAAAQSLTLSAVFQYIDED